MNKVIAVEDVKKYIQSNMTILVGGFGATGSPLTILDALAQQSDIHNLTIVSNNLGENGQGLHKVFMAGQIQKAIGSFFTINKEAVQAWSRGELEIELIPQGTLAEAVRCGGAGIGGFYTKTAVGTTLANGKELREIKGQQYVYEESITGDVALIRAHKADKMGNLVYHETARNFNPMMATAAQTVIVEVDEIVEVGELDANVIVTPSVYVDYIVETKYTKEGDRYVEAK